MKRTLLIVALISIATCQVISKSEACTCAQLLTTADCGRNPSCSWNSTKLVCEIPQSTGPVTVTKNYGKSLYCEGQAQTDCLKMNECAWVDNKCTFFTSCTPYEKTTKDECQGISKRCITDGQICVEIDSCNTYLTQTSCYQNKLSNYCIWDDSTKKCLDVTDCSQLPITLTKDSECRQYLKKECTAKSGGGCVESGTNCEDQTSTEGCETNKARTVNCFWGDNKCLEKKCENALPDRRTHDSCQLFSEKCTANENGGCVDLKTCADGKILEGCKIDSARKECYWSTLDKKCKDKVCVNAPNTLKTNSECQKQFLATCITNGGGCVEDTSCGSSTVAEQCSVNRYNNRSCTWLNGTCKDKTCDNAGTENIGHDQCTNYSKACTGKANNAAGCQNRTCENAPTTIISNPGCEDYLPNKNCITKKDGGCITNTTCQAIQVKDACVKDLNKKDCYWDTVGNNCVDKTCASLPARFNNHPGCNGEINTCTVNSSGTCVDLVCENVVDKDNCLKDKDGGECIYYGSCFQKQCSAAPVTLTSHAECKDYLSTCTLTNLKKGCMNLPLTCSGLLVKENCELKANGEKCGWTGSSCVDIVCTTAPTKTDDDYSVNLCEAYKPNSNCVPTQTKKGCMELVAKCESRTIIEQCTVAASLTNGGKTCLWDSVNSKCYEKTCANATKLGNDASVVLTSGTASHNDCKGWLKDKDNNPLCVVGLTNDVCAPVPVNCSGLGKNSCLVSNVLKVANSNPVEYQNCFWNVTTEKCVDGNICANLDKNTHDSCSSASNNKCTVSADDSKCVDRLACSQYTKAPQCKKDKNDSPCTWNVDKCSDTLCLDTAEDTKNFITHVSCTNKSNQCTVTNLPCGLKKTACTDYVTALACVGGKLGDKTQCVWDGTAKTCGDLGTFNCTLVKGKNLTGGYCNSLDATCSVNAAGTACIVAKNTCGDYTATLTECKWSKTEKDCLNISSTCKAVSTLKCSEISGANDIECRTLKSSCIFGSAGKCKPNCSSLPEPQTYNTCQNFDSECSVQNDGKTCYYIDKNCSLLTTNTCTKGKDGKLCKVTGSTCGDLTTITDDTKCGEITSATNNKLTPKYCGEASGNKCTAKPDGSACAKIAATCTDYSTGNTNLDLCYYSAAGYCVIDTTCKAIGTSACSAIILGGTTNLNHNTCQEMESTCTTTDPVSTKCADYTAPTPVCADYKGTYNFFNCFHFLSTCTVNAAGTACIDNKATCGLYDASDKCAYAITDGPCVWDATTSKCLQKSCDAISTTDVPAPTIDTCSAKQQNCTVRTGGCMKRVACTSYTIQEQCNTNVSGGKCIWNSTSNKCFDKTCINADSTYNDHTKCQGVGSCTVKLGEDGTTLGGCINLGACADYKVIDQCKINSTKKDCEWSLVETPNKCVDKSCTSADPATYTDFDKCQAYYKAGECTLAAKKNEDGTYAEGGCMTLALCTEYNTQNQCKKSKNKDTNGNVLNCFWNDTTKKCADASCAQADDTFTTHDACVGYGNPINLKCTVDKDDKGCVLIPDTCEEMSKGQCVNVDSKSNKCIWLEGSGSGSCVTRTCENAVSPATASDCQNHLPYCTMIDTGSKCKTKTCEDYNFTDDVACGALFKNKKCTTNGKFCVNRATCQLAQSQKGCTLDISLNACEWIVPTDTTKPAYCVQKTCNTAPKEYTTESQCLQYYTPPNNGATCTTQQGGGCVQRSSCSAAKVQAACFTDASGFVCAWDADTSTCRNSECKDLSGTTHAACQNPSDKNFKGKCTAGKGGKCAPVQKCGLTTVEAACVKGTDGPCIWIPDYLNNDASKGACFLYDSCRSLTWTSDPLCKLISDKCTTDGKECIGITSCAKTNVNGCVTGTDKECIKTVETLGSANKVCTKYASCNSALFTTHLDCQDANPKCTTNGTSSCIELAACSTYVKEACKYNKDGTIRNSSGQITSNGRCHWDETTNACRDQNCSELLGATHALCSSQLITCTTDGTNCIVKDSCPKYTTNSACINSMGTEGLCQWVEGTGGAAGTCRVKTCDDITGGTNAIACSIIDTCTTDGTKCITKGTCDKYTTKAGCNTRGTDGICVWTETITGTTTTGKCSLMTNCAAAAKDQNACQYASNKCKWTAGSTTVASSCVDHTCESYNASFGRCSYFPNWDSSKYNICRNVAGKCTAADPKTLLETECYTQSAYMYSWNSKTSACSQCGTTIVTPNNNSTNGNTTNNDTTSTDSGYVLGVAVLLGYLMY